MRRAAPDWTVFLRGLAQELDAGLGAARRDLLLRSAGLRMAALLPVPQAASLAALTLEINEVLARLGWGEAAIAASDTDRALHVTHRAPPRLGAAGDPPGTWFAAVLEGLYQGWLAQQDPAARSLTVRRHGGADPERMHFRCARIEPPASGSG